MSHLIVENNGILTEDSLIFLRKKFDAVDADSKIVRGIWDELEKYVVPYRGRMFQKDSGEGAVEWDKYDHYDDTAVISAQTLSASVHGAILPPIQWFLMNFKDEDLKNDDDASDWLADSNKRTYHAIDNSNFALEADELILDLTGFGHGFMVDEPSGKDNDLMYSMVSLKEAFFEEAFDGSPYFFFRKLEWTATKLVSKFGYDDLPKKVQKSYDNASTASDAKFVVIFAIYPRSANATNDTTTMLNSAKRPWGHAYFLHTEKEQIGKTGGYYEMPVYSVRWRKVSGSQWGHGPGHVALGDIKQLNQHRLMRTRAVEKAIDPANMVTQRGLLSTLNLGPRGLTVVKSKDSLWVHESKANFAVSREELELLRDSIRQAFHVDQLELKESPAMTATEVQVRYELMNRLLGPTQGRIKVDWLNRIVENAFKNEMREGRLLPLPEILRNKSLEIGIEYLGALATAQKSQLANDMFTWAAQGVELSQAYPRVKYVVDEVELYRQIGRLKNVPEKVINGEDDVKRLEDEEAKIIAKQQKIAEAQAEGEAAKAQGEGQQALREAV